MIEVGDWNFSSSGNASYRKDGVEFSETNGIYIDNTENRRVDLRSQSGISYLRSTTYSVWIYFEQNSVCRFIEEYRTWGDEYYKYYTAIGADNGGQLRVIIIGPQGYIDDDNNDMKVFLSDEEIFPMKHGYIS